MLYYSRLLTSINLVNPARHFASSTNNIATLRLYRILLRQLYALPKQDEFLLQPPLNPRDYGRARIMKASPPTSHPKDLFTLFTQWNQVGGTNDDDDPFLTWYNDLVGEDLDEQDFLDDDIDTCIWTTRASLLEAMRIAFRSSSTLDTSTLRRFAIVAIQALNDVETMQDRSSVSVAKKGLRVVATSSCIGTASSGIAFNPETKHRFAYRIRVENLHNNDKTVQLLGRTWVIQEHHKDTSSSSGTTVANAPVVVSAPTTGAVGHLPVLPPGHVFEYMSGCELATLSGSMGGMFHMAVVPTKTPSAMVGDPIDAFAPDFTKFELTVQPFPLIAD